MTLNATNYDHDTSEQPINERTPLLRKDSSSSSTVVASTDDEESIASSLPGKEPFVDIPRQDIASVISVLLLGEFLSFPRRQYHPRVLVTSRFCRPH
jgi:hypothetical protein